MGYNHLAQFLQTPFTHQNLWCVHIPIACGYEKHQLVIKFLNFKLVVQMCYV